MRKLFILAALVACCAATPLHSHEEDEAKEHIYSVPLQRPSPISPDVPSDPKPTETVSKITDPKEVAKYKREVADEVVGHSTPLIPTVQPGTYSGKKESHESHEDQLPTGAAAAATLHRQKRDHKAAAVDQKNSTPTTKTAVKKDSPTLAPAHSKKTAPAPDTQKHRQRREVQAHPDASATSAAVPLIHRDEGKQPPALRHDVPHQSVDSQHLQQQQQHNAGFASAQTLPAHLPAGQPVKRDIPVPLVPKYQHPEESPKSGEKQDGKKTEYEKTEKDSKESVESGENKHSAEQKKSTDSKEDSNESQKPVVNHTTEHHALHPQQAHHPHDNHPQHPHAEHYTAEEQTNDAAAASSSSGTSTEHPVIRQKPVPVAELFSRPRQ